MEIKEVIEKLADDAIKGDSSDALKYSQAALNLAHVLATMDNLSE